MNKIESITLSSEGLKFSAQLYGDASELPLVMCLHGFPDGPQSFSRQIDDLLEAGYQVATVTIRGYEPSSIPKNYDFTIASLARDVSAWIDQLTTNRVHLVGHDWGAVIAYFTAFTSPEKLQSLTTIAIPHPQRFSSKGLIKVPIQILKSWYMLFNQIPYVSNKFACRGNFSFLKFLWRQWSPGYTLNDQRWHELCDQFSQPGVLDAMLSYYRQNVSPMQLLGLRKSALNTPFPVNAPNLAITGEQDGCIDTRVFDHCVLEEDHPKGRRIERIAGAGHFVHQEKPEQVNRLLLEWFKHNN